MTVSQSIVTWLYTNTTISVNDTVDTDTLAATAAAYGLYKTPQTTVIPYVDGTRDVTAYYTFLLRQRSNEDGKRQNNQAWLEALEAWVQSKRKARTLPTLSAPRQCHDVFVANSFAVIETESDESVYQITIGINYTE